MQAELLGDTPTVKISPLGHDGSLLGQRLFNPTHVESLREHLSQLGPMPTRSPGEIITMVEQAGLLGRGGAGFPAHRKLRAVASQGRASIVVANGSESEPASRKDAMLLTLRPHLVLDGAVAAARAVGADHIVVYIHQDNNHLSAILQHAIGERSSARSEEPSITLAHGEPGFVSGESTAVVSSINGLGARPVFGQRNSTAGVLGRPTLVHNVETLAHIGSIVRFGPTVFRQFGEHSQLGPQLGTLTGAVSEPGRVFEVLEPTTIGNILVNHGGVVTTPQAVLVGGYGGTFLNGLLAMTTPYTRGALAAHHASIGCGLLGVVPQGRCGIQETSKLLRYLASQTAGQCGPCVHGLAGIANVFDSLAAGKARRRTIATIERQFALTEGRGACSHPDATVALARSALSVFHQEVDLHLERRCSETNTREIFDVP